LLNRTLGSPADAAAVTSHGDGLDLLDDVLEELLGAGELPAIDGLGGLAGVLERNTEVRAARASRLRRGNLSGSVPNLRVVKRVPVSPSSSKVRSSKIPISNMRPPFLSLQNLIFGPRDGEMKISSQVGESKFQHRRGHSPSWLLVDGRGNRPSVVVRS